MKTDEYNFNIQFKMFTNKDAFTLNKLNTLRSFILVKIIERNDLCLKHVFK